MRGEGLCPCHQVDGARRSPQYFICSSVDLHCGLARGGFEKNNWNYSTGIQFKFYRGFAFKIPVNNGRASRWRRSHRPNDCDLKILIAVCPVFERRADIVIE